MRYIYAHYSFDLWQTLIKSNSDFKVERAKYFHKNFNPMEKDVLEIQAIIRDIDIKCNHINEVVGKNIDALEMYAMVLFRLGFELKDVTYGRLQVIYDEMYELFEKLPPVFYPNTIDVLRELKAENKGISILSNTAFIRGEMLNYFLYNQGVKGLFSFMVYSDFTLYSKPNPKMYNFLWKCLDNLYGGRINPIHIGDNPVSDIKGAEAAGIRSFQINSNDRLITDIP